VRWRWVTSPEQRLPDTEEILAEGKRVAGETKGKATSKLNKAAPKKPAKG